MMTGVRIALSLALLTTVLWSTVLLTTVTVAAQEKPPSVPKPTGSSKPKQAPKQGQEKAAKPGDAKKTAPPRFPAPPQGRATQPLPIVLEPARSAVERRDLIQRFTPRHPIEGFYRLKAMVVNGNVQKDGSRGFLVVGQRHLSMQLYAPGSAPDLANIQAVFRKYRIVNDTMVMSTLLGHRNKANGDIALEKVGHATDVRFILAGATLRLQLNRDEYLEFDRIE